MQITILLLRLAHIVFGAYWFGAVAFLALFLEPSARAAGPVGGQMMAQLQRLKFSQWTMVAAALTIVSGITLLGIDSQWFKSAWMSSHMAIALQIGGLLAIIGAAIGSAVARPAVARLGVIMPQLAQMAPGPEREQLDAEAKRLSGRLRTAGRTTAILIAITVALMATARYL